MLVPASFISLILPKRFSKNVYVVVLELSAWLLESSMIKAQCDIFNITTEISEKRMCFSLSFFQEGRQQKGL
jgi:hypothetical protein